jgi:phosphoribosyl 1,2-cyclic phosphate phosphodiesterase
MEVIFLGTGTSEGVPIIAQPPEIQLDLSNPKNWRTRTSVHVIMDGCHVQVDAAPEFRLQCINNDIRQIDHFILTHEHADHIQGMDDLRRFCRLKGGVAIPVYSTDAGLDRVRAIYPYAVRQKAKGNYPAFSLISMPSILEVEGGLIYSVLLPHGKFQVLGLVFEERSTGKRFAYYTDCKEVTKVARDLALYADILALDALRYKPHSSHLSLPEAIEASKHISARKTYFVHMACGLDYDNVKLGLPDEMYLAYDGLRLDI